MFPQIPNSNGNGTFTPAGMPAGAAPAQAATAAPVVPQAQPTAESLAGMFAAAAQAQPAPTAPAGGQASFTLAEGSPPPAGISTAPPAVAPSQPSLAQQAHQLGIELPATATDADVAAALMQRYQQLAPIAQFGQSLLPFADQMQDFFRNQAQQPAGQQQPGQPQPQVEWTPENHFAKLWNAPQLTPEMQFAINQGMVIRNDETGLMEPRPGMEIMVAPILHGLNAAVNHQRQQWQEVMASNPYQKFFGAMQEPIQRLIDQRVKEQLATVQSQAADINGINQFDQANQTWLYQANANGGQMLSPAGEYFTQQFKQRQQSWTGTTGDLLNLCRDLTELAVIRAAQPGQQPAPAVQQAQPFVPPQQVVPQQINQQRQQSFLNAALANATHVPSAGANVVQSPAGPIAVSQGELDQMFLNDFRAQAGHSAAA
jgi:hypothetical protein